ncbi:MAG TPA: S8 family serine peptidase [Chthoniobacterales bacterium]|nr:S8 family serine peptidase [Chthoniobacterales bacterium]
MELLVKALVHAGLSLLLLSACIWFGRSIATTYWRKDMPSEIRPLEVSGLEDAEKKGVFLARILSARLRKLESDLRRANAAIAEARSAKLESAVSAPVDFAFLLQPVDLPKDVFKPLALEMSVAQVEVGKLFSWLHSWLGQKHALTLSAYYSEKGATVAGPLGREGDDPLWVHVESKDDLELVEQIAYAIAQRPFARRVKQAELLKTKQFGDLLEVFIAVAELGKQGRTGNVRPSEYEEHYLRLAPLTAEGDGRLSQWQPLVHATAQLAERAEKYEEALRDYDRALRLLPAAPPGVPDPDKEQRRAIQTQIARLRLKSAPEEVASVADPSAAIAELMAPLLESIGATGIPNAPEPPVVALAGAMPPDGLLPAGRLEFLPMNSDESGSSRNNYDFSLRQYTGDLIRSVLAVAPDAKFIVAEVPDNLGLGEKDLLSAMKRLAESDRPHVTLFAYKLGVRSPLQKALVALVEKGIPVVISAGNEPDAALPFDGDRFQNRFALAAAADKDGRPASFATRGPAALWVPGTDIPTLHAEKIIRQSGSGFSAALLAGIIGRIRAEHPRLTPAEVVKLLHDSAPPSTSPSVPLVNLQAALALAAQTPPSSSPRNN